MLSYYYPHYYLIITYYYICYVSHNVSYIKHYYIQYYVIICHYIMSIYYYCSNGPFSIVPTLIMDPLFPITVQWIYHFPLLLGL